MLPELLLFELGKMTRENGRRLTFDQQLEKATARNENLRAGVGAEGGVIFRV